MLPCKWRINRPTSHPTERGVFDEGNSRLVITSTARDVHDVLRYFRSDTEYVGMRPPLGSSTRS
jgi:hypothetical protein